MKSVYLAYVLNLLNVHVYIKTNQLLLLNAAVYVISHVVMEYRLYCMFKESDYQSIRKIFIVDFLGQFV